MGRELSANVVVLDEAQNPVLLTAGSEVPKWAADQVGDHCFATDDPGDGELQFKTKAEAVEYAQANSLDVDEGLKADEYKAAVAAAAAAAAGTTE